MERETFICIGLGTEAFLNIIAKQTNRRKGRGAHVALFGVVWGLLQNIMFGKKMRIVKEMEKTSPQYTNVDGNRRHTQYLQNKTISGRRMEQTAKFVRIGYTTRR